MATLKIIDNGEEIHLPSRTAEIVRRVVEISAEIERLASGHVTFNIKGRSVIPELRKCYRASETEEKT
jgi:hypothetical protein